MLCSETLESHARVRISSASFFLFFFCAGIPRKTLGIHYIAFFSFFVISPGELGGLLRGARAHDDDRRTLEVPGCSSALCLRFSCCRGRARPVSSGAALQVRLSAACLRVAFVSQSRHRAGDVARRRRAGGLQPRLSSSRRAGSQDTALPRPPATASRAALSAGQKSRKQVPTKKRSKTSSTDLDLCGHAEVRGG